MYLEAHDFLAVVGDEVFGVDLVEVDARAAVDCVEGTRGDLLVDEVVASPP